MIKTATVHWLQKSWTNYVTELLRKNTEREISITKWWRKHWLPDMKQFGEEDIIVSVRKPIHMRYYSYKRYMSTWKADATYKGFLYQAAEYYISQKIIARQLLNKNRSFYTVSYDELLRQKLTEAPKLELESWLNIWGSEINVVVPIKNDVDWRIIDWWWDWTRKKWIDFDYKFYIEKDYLNHLTREEREYLTQADDKFYHYIMTI